MDVIPLGGTETGDDSGTSGGATEFFGSLGRTVGVGLGSPLCAIARPLSLNLQVRTMPNSTSSPPIAIQPYLLGFVTFRAPLLGIGVGSVRPPFRASRRLGTSTALPSWVVSLGSIRRAARNLALRARGFFAVSSSVAMRGFRVSSCHVCRSRNACLTRRSSRE